MKTEYLLCRITVLFVVILSIVSLLYMPVFAYAYGGELYNSNLEWELDADTGVLTISGTGPMPNYNSGDFAPYCGNVNGRDIGPIAKTFVVSDGVTHIGNYALNPRAKGTINVQKAYVASTVVSIGDSALHTAEVVIYSENCSFGSYPFSDTTTIFCYAGSTAHAYAVEHGNNYVLMCKEHHPETRDAVEPTCSEAGYSGDIYCTVCDMLLETGSIVPALGHDYQIVNAVAPTCIEPGYSGDSVCTRCEDVAVEGTALSPLGHDWSSWSLAAPPTCTSPGYSLRICNRCSNAERSVVDALGHTWDQNSTIAIHPTCTDPGSIQKTCIICHGTVTEEIAPLGHEYKNHLCVRCGEIDPDLKNPFEDVKLGEFFYNPVLWAYFYDPQITSGTSEKTFSPYDTCTRAQIVTFLWRAACSPEPRTANNLFADVTPEKYYYKAVLWAAENGITSGTSDTTFSPDDSCTRGQVVSFLWRFAGSPEPETVSNPFIDVKSENYYYKAVLWAAETGVTSGTTKTTFDPDDTCTRAQIVTFLYRYMNG